VDAGDPAHAAEIDAFLQGDATGLSRAEAACLLSHRHAWQRLLDGQDPFLAVFEDDVHLADDIRTLLAAELVPAGIDLIKLEWPLGKVSYARHAHAPYRSRSLHRLLTRAYGAAGYIVSRACARRLLEITASCRDPVDVVLFDDKSPIWREFPVLQVVPAPCIQDHALARLNQASVRFGSAIETGRQDVKAHRDQARRRKAWFSTQKLRRYFSCVLNGADPFHYRRHVPLALGRPGGDPPAG
jgi:GR25 family glycosyltransferase involved in LPS biosynthesis